MLDFNRRTTCADQINAIIDAAIESERGAVPARAYLGGSRLGAPCERALQFEFTGAPKDEGSHFKGQTLRIVDLEGNQAADVIFYSAADLAEAMGDRTWLEDKAGRLVDEKAPHFADLQAAYPAARSLLQQREAERTAAARAAESASQA